MDLGLSGQRVLVTGAARAQVCVNDIGRKQDMDAVCSAVEAAGGRAIAIEADVGTPEAAQTLIAAATARWGGIDVLVNNAAVVLVSPLTDTSDDDWERVLATNLTGPFRLCRAVVPGMRARGRGVIVNVASELAYLGRANYAGYTAAKGGLVSLTRSLARELAPVIRVNAVAPGPTDTPMLASELTTPALREREIDIPMRRLARPEEIASAVVFLASDQASFFCGEIISPNGGVLMR